MINQINWCFTRYVNDIFVIYFFQSDVLCEKTDPNLKSSFE